MAKILGVKINYPKGINKKIEHKNLQNTAMKFLANYLVKKLPEEAIKELISRLK